MTHLKAEVEEVMVRVKNFVHPDRYGKKLPTRWSVRLKGEKRWRHLWNVCVSNVGSFYVVKGGQSWFVDSDNLLEAAGK
jgi:hypothetical protein